MENVVTGPGILKKASDSIWIPISWLVIGLVMMAAVLWLFKSTFDDIAQFKQQFKAECAPYHQVDGTYRFPVLGIKVGHGLTPWSKDHFMVRTMDGWIEVGSPQFNALHDGSLVHIHLLDDLSPELLPD